MKYNQYSAISSFPHFLISSFPISSFHIPGFISTHSIHRKCWVCGSKHRLVPTIAIPYKPSPLTCSGNWERQGLGVLGLGLGWSK